jgi:polysaccharide biosynthesis transport protein
MNDINADRLPAAVSQESGVPANRPYSGIDVGYPMAPTAEVAEDIVDFGEVLRVLRKRKRLVAAFMISGLTISFLCYLLITPIYKATIRLQVDPESKIVEKGDIGTGESQSMDNMQTELELLQSRNLAERVASLTNLSSELQPQKPSGASLSMLLGGKSKETPRPAPGGTEVSVGVDAVLAGRAVKLIPGSRLIDISYTDKSAARAQRVANAFGEAFINFNLDKRLESNAYAKTFLDDQIKQLKIRLQDAEKAMIEFAQKEQLVALNDKDSKTTSNYDQASAALSAATAERIKNELQWKQVEAANAINLPQFLTNATISSLRAARGTLSTEYQEKASTYGPGYPAMTEIRNKIAEIDHQLSAEVKTIKASYKAAYEASLAQEVELKKQLAATRNDALDTQRRSIQYNILKREVDTTRALYESLLQRFKEVDVASGVGVNNVFVVDRAEVPRAPFFPVRSTFLAFGLLAGLFSGGAVAYLLERLDDVIHTSDEAESLCSMTMLGIIPSVKDFEAEMRDPRSVISEAYRSLCTTLQLSTADGLPKSILITSSMPAEGKSTTGHMIARQYAAMGLRVLLVDSDLRNASLHHKLGVEGAVGLSNYLTSGCTPSEAIIKIDGKHPFYFMSSGPLPPNSAELLSGKRMRDLIDVSSHAFDLVLVDGPPIMGLADAPILTRAVKAVVLVVAAGQTRKPALQAALKRLTLARANIVGLVLTKLDVKSYGYGYGYGYGGHAYGQLEYHPELSTRKEGKGDGDAAAPSKEDVDNLTSEGLDSSSKTRFARFRKHVGLG